MSGQWGRRTSLGGVSGWGKETKAVVPFFRKTVPAISPLFPHSQGTIQVGLHKPTGHLGRASTRLVRKALVTTEGCAMTKFQVASTLKFHRKLAPRLKSWERKMQGISALLGSAPSLLLTGSHSPGLSSLSRREQSLSSLPTCHIVMEGCWLGKPASESLDCVLSGECGRRKWRESCVVLVGFSVAVITP